MTDARSTEVGPLLATVLRRNLRSERAAQELSDSQELLELGLDSITAVNLLLDIEETFGVTFPVSMLDEDTFRSVGSLRHALETLQGADAARRP